MPRVVVTLSTIPSREASIVQTIESIKSGTTRVDAIYVNLPKWYPRFACLPDPTLESRLILAGAIVTRCDDYGALTKVIPTMAIEKDPQTLIIVIDDDMIYSPCFVAGLLQGYREFKCPVGYSGILYPERSKELNGGKLRYYLVTTHGALTDILEGSSGFLFRRDDLSMVEIFKPMPVETGADISIYKSDDYVYGRILDCMKIQKRVVNYPWIGRKGDDWSLIRKQTEGTQEYALSNGEFNLETYIKAGIQLESMGLK